MSAEYARLPLALSWFEDPVWRIIAYLPSGHSGLESLTTRAEDPPAGRRLMSRLGPTPVARLAENLEDTVVHWPLQAANRFPSRFSDGTRYGLLYAGLERETALAETAHYYRRFFDDADIPLARVPRQSRGVFTFRVAELVADTRKAAPREKRLVADDHDWCRGFGDYLARHLQSGLLYRSVRRREGSALALLRSEHISGLAWVEAVEIHTVGGRVEVAVV